MTEHKTKSNKGSKVRVLGDIDVPVTVNPRLDARRKVCYDASPHLLDLQWKTDDGSGVEAIRKVSALRNTPAGKLRAALDERVHLRDIRSRTFSGRPRGWRDFPPSEAKTLRQAALITVSRFFREHPLADLTIVTVLYLSALLIWRCVIHPAKFLLSAGSRGSDANERPAITDTPAFMMPALPAPAMAHAQAEVPRARLGLTFHNPPGWKKGLVGFAAAAVLFVLPLGAYSSLGNLQMDKDAVIENSMQGAALLKEAGESVKSQDFAGANAKFSEAEERFTEAKERLGSIGNAITYAATLVPTTGVVSIAQPLLTVGKETAAGGAILTRGLMSLDSNREPIDKLKILKSHLGAALPHLTHASEALSRVPTDALPDEYTNVAATAKSELPKLLQTLNETLAATELLESILGADEQKRYLLVFQNNAELRPTGGFIGSFALLDVRRGQVMNLEIPGGGSYDLQGSLRERLISPRPLHLINPHWQFQDANWSPDFPTSAAKLAWFYEKSGGPTTDGTIAITASLMEDLLGILGPIDMPEYDTTVDEENFVIATQKEVELEYDREQNRPKQFISDLAPKVLDRVTGSDPDTLLELAAILHNALATKDLIVWFRNEEMQTKAGSLGWTGNVQETGGDYLYIVHTNIAGQKTDIVMQEKVDHEVKLLADGTGIVTLTIQRTHGGDWGDLFSGVRNVDYLRVYVPNGSTLVEARGFTPPDPKLMQIPDPEYVHDPSISEQEAGIRTDRASGTQIFNDAGKTVFGNWVQTDPGETSIVTLVYRIPAGVIKLSKPDEGGINAIYGKITDLDGPTLSYSLLVQKQPGSNPVEFTSKIDAPKGYFPIWQTHEREEDERGRLTVTEILTQDAFYSTIVQTQ